MSARTLVQAYETEVERHMLCARRQAAPADAQVLVGVPEELHLPFPELRTQRSVHEVMRRYCPAEVVFVFTEG